MKDVVIYRNEASIMGYKGIDVKKVLSELEPENVLYYQNILYTETLSEEDTQFIKSMLKQWGGSIKKASTKDVYEPE